MKAQTIILNEQKYAISEEKSKDINEKIYNTQEKTASRQDRVNNSQGNTVVNVILLDVEQIKKEQDESIQVKDECNSEPENECKETLHRSNTEYKQLYEHHIVKDELVIGQEVKQETYINIDCVPTDEAEYDQRMSEDKNCCQRTVHTKPKNKTNIVSDTVCHLCNKIFCDKNHRNRHTKYRCPMNQTKKNSFICDRCKKCYDTKDSLVAHIMSEHSNTMNGLLKHYSFTNRNTKAKVCNLCNNAYKNQSSLNLHLKYYCSMKQYKTMPPTTCDLCNKVFKHQHSLKKHLNYTCSLRQNKTTQPKAACSLCNKVFSCAINRNVHIKRHCPMNPNKVIYKCDTCNKCYQRKSFLVAHIMSEHSDTMNVIKYRCDHCGKEYVRKISLIDHIRVKHMKNTYRAVCNLCNKVFANKQYKKKHITYSCPMNKNKVKNPVHQQKMACQHCNKVFSSRSCRNYHSRYHCPRNQTEATCDLCNKIFSSRYKLYLHMRKACPMKQKTSELIK